MPQPGLRTRKEELQLQLDKQLVKEAAPKCIKKKAENGGKLPSKGMTDALEELGCSSLSGDKVNYQIKKIESGGGLDGDLSGLVEGRVLGVCVQTDFSGACTHIVRQI